SGWWLFLHTSLIAVSNMTRMLGTLICSGERSSGNGLFPCQILTFQLLGLIQLHATVAQFCLRGAGAVLVGICFLHKFTGDISILDIITVDEFRTISLGLCLGRSVRFPSPSAQSKFTVDHDLARLPDSILLH